MNSNGKLGARVRVYLPTYHRPKLLPRALASLREQTLSDWVCEVHNDASDDPFPGELIRSLNDPRIQLVQHERNLGSVSTFNLFYHPTAEPFYGMLEDDNTWKPGFLETMVAALELHPEVTLAWCSQHVCREEADGLITDTGRKIAAFGNDNNPFRLCEFGDIRQAVAALHSNGSALFRSRKGQSFATPEIPFSGVEHFRERLVPSPLLYVNQTLAVFTETQQTARARDRDEWAPYLVALASTFLRHAQLDQRQLAELWQLHRKRFRGATLPFLFSALLVPCARPLLKQLTLRDWIWFAAYGIRHPRKFLRCLRSRQIFPKWWSILDACTAERFAESRIRLSSARKAHSLKGADCVC